MKHPRILARTGLRYGDIKAIADALNLTRGHVHQVARGTRLSEDVALHALIADYRAAAVRATRETQDAA